MVFLAATRAAAASDRLAVLVVVEGDPDLSDNLTEVAISKLALRRDRLLVGLREVRESLGDILGEPGIGGCVEQPACLARLGATTQAETALVGDVRRDADRFVVHLSLVNTRTAVREAEFHDTVPGEMKPLITAIRSGVASLFEAKAAPPTPPGAAAASSPAPAPSPPPLPPGLRESPEPPPSLVEPSKERPAREGWLTAAGYGAGGAAIIALSAAIVIGNDATHTPTGANRAEIYNDLQRHETEATIANSLFIVAGTLAVAAIAAFVWRWRHD